MLALLAAALAAPAVHVSVVPASPRVASPAAVVVRASGRPHVDAITPAGEMHRIAVRRRGGAWRGVVRFDEEGRWQVVARVGKVRARRSVVVRPRAVTPPPASFGPLGAPGCTPPSPRNRAGDFLRRAEIFGTTAGGRFWALFAFNPAGVAWASDDTASFAGLVGKEIKIVFKLTGVGRFGFFAVAPDGAEASPIWGPTPHGSSSWDRAGSEWGAGFVFAEAGCWRIHARLGPTAGDIYLDIRS